MIRNVLIMTITGGILLFSQEFPGGIQQPRLGGQLITAIIEFGQQTTGMGVSHINLKAISIAIVTNETNNLFCALFYDRADGKLFGKLICSEILGAFIQNYASDPQFAQTGRNLKDFIGFQRKIQHVAYYAIRPVMSLLESMHGIYKAIVLRDLEVIDSQRDEVNEFVILANLPKMLQIAEELRKFYPSVLLIICFVLFCFNNFFSSVVREWFSPECHHRIRFERKTNDLENSRKVLCHLCRR
jgi:hypothetical protein